MKIYSLLELTLLNTNLKLNLSRGFVSLTRKLQAIYWSEYDPYLGKLVI